MNETKLKFYKKMYEIYKTENLTLKTQLQEKQDIEDKLRSYLKYSEVIWREEIIEIIDGGNNK